MTEQKMGELYTLKTGAPPNKQLIENVERLLADVKTGAVQGVAFAGARRDGARLTYFDATRGSWHDVSGALMSLNWRFGQHLAEFGEGVPDLPEEWKP